MRFVAPNNCSIDVPLKPIYDKYEEISPGFVSKRFEFDNFLIEEVKQSSNIDFKEGIEINDFETILTDLNYLIKRGA